MYESPTITELGSVADFTRQGTPNQAVDATFLGFPIDAGPTTPPASTS
jgi:hypothetical protein